MDVPVLLPKIFDYPLTYSTRDKSIRSGDLVQVPFGKKKEIGVVWDKTQKTGKKIRIKTIDKKIRNNFFNKNLIKFVNWFSVYNLSPRGLVLKMCLGNLKNFEKKGIFKNNFYNNIQNKFKLSEEQEKSVQNLNSFGEKFQTTLIEGVTGSGKTLVYFQRIKKIITENKQALVLLPEIFLTNQFKDRFNEFFGFEPYIWHSKITPKNKKKIWDGIHTNKIKILIGARSALFLPFKNLGLIIVDEEHDPSYKQEDVVIYNARDMAIMRASIENIPIHLVTSVPSLETFNNVKKNKYKQTFLKKRFNNFKFPKTKVVNLNLEKMKKSFIAEQTIEIVKDYLKKGNQVLFFLNRRGYSPFLICKDCGFKHLCPHCSIYLTYHKIKKKVVCHFCGYENKIINTCKKTQNKCNFSMFGPGVERIFDELKIKLPERKIKIFSSDYLSKKKESEKIFEEIKKKDIDILVGTQMISKGFNFPKLNCIVVVDADFSGRGYDLRATEKNIQLYNQLSGRAGRFSDESIIVYQTLNPNSETLNDLIINNPKKFLEEELVLRKGNNLPPFSKLIAIIVTSKHKEKSFRGAQEIKIRLSKIDNMDVLGPVESPVSKLKNKYRTRLLIRTNSQFFAQKPLMNLIKNLKISSQIKLTVDVDPINFV